MQQNIRKHLQVKLRLAVGDGPVYLTGTHSQETKEEVDSESGMALS